MSFIRAYLRASTEEQDSERGMTDIKKFAEDKNITIANFYIENKSGASLDRPELTRLISDCQLGDIILVEDIDRLTRLNYEDWKILKNKLSEKQIKIVSANLPLTWTVLDIKNIDSIETRITSALNDMLIEVLSALARSDYEQRRKRQAQGIAKAKKVGGKYQGRKPDLVKYRRILTLLDNGFTWADIRDTLKCSSKTIANAKKWRKKNINTQSAD